jgi:hypothetical protein
MNRNSHSHSIRTCSDPVLDNAYPDVNDYVGRCEEQEPALPNRHMTFGPRYTHTGKPENSVDQNRDREPLGDDPVLLHFSGRSFIIANRKGCEERDPVTANHANAQLPPIKEPAPRDSGFMVELHHQFFGLAFRNNSGGLRLPRHRQHPEGISQLSIYVYPDSIVHHPYFDAATRTIKRKLIPLQQFLLEISKKPRMSRGRGGAELGVLYEEFRPRLKSYATSLQMDLAIDESGVSYASSRHSSNSHPSYRDGEAGPYQFSDVVIRYTLEITIKKRGQSKS